MRVRGRINRACRSKIRESREKMLSCREAEYGAERIPRRVSLLVYLSR